MQVREKVGKSRFTVFFPTICGSGGSKSRLAKAAGAEPAGQMRDQKLHAVLARSTFVSKEAKNTSRSDHFLEVEVSKKCTPLWREAHVQVKSVKDCRVRTTFGRWDAEKVPLLWGEAHFQVKMYKARHSRTTFGS